MTDALPAVGTSARQQSAYDWACESWDGLIRAVSYLQMYGRVRRILEAERRGDHLPAVEALDDAAAVRAWAHDFHAAIEQMIREGALG